MQCGLTHRADRVIEACERHLDEESPHLSICHDMFSNLDQNLKACTAHPGIVM
jgi:hypothetical protein